MNLLPKLQLRTTNALTLELIASSLMYRGHLETWKGNPGC
jgi:hypothetical protein